MSIRRKRQQAKKGRNTDKREKETQTRTVWHEREQILIQI